MMTGRETVKVRKAMRLLREAHVALEDYFRENGTPTGKSSSIASVKYRTRDDVAILFNALTEEGR